MLLFVYSAQLEHNVKNARSYIEVPKDADHVLELGLFTNFKAVLKGRKGLELFEKVADSLNIKA